MSPKITAFLRQKQPATPCLIVDLDIIEQNYQALHKALPHAHIYYAVKANPAQDILKILAHHGCAFDVASIGEIKLCLALNIPPSKISFGNTVKSKEALIFSHQIGISLFAFDSREELEKIAKYAPKSRVYCRLAVINNGASWPLSRKFGTDTQHACDLLRLAKSLDLEPVGVSFHVGSQQSLVSAYDDAIAQAAPIFHKLKEDDIHLSLLNLGGGFPSDYGIEIPKISAFGTAIKNAIEKYLPDFKLHLMVEPGRYMVGNAGIIHTEVLLASTRSSQEGAIRWVYLDIGRFGGLAETEGESICYPFKTEKDDAEKIPSIIAGPTCDSADVLYEKKPIMLPHNLIAGDKIMLLSTGAYVSTYCSTSFNGFEPLKEYYL